MTMTESNPDVADRTLVSPPSADQALPTTEKKADTPTTFPYTGTLPVGGVLVERGETGSSALIKYGPDDEQCLLGSAGRRGIAIIDRFRVKVIPNKKAPTTMPENGTKVLVFRVNHRPGRVFSLAELWVLDAEYQAAKAKVRPYVCADDPTKNVAVIKSVSANHNSTLGESEANNGEPLFTHVNGRLSIWRRGLDFETGPSDEKELPPTGTQVYFKRIDNPREGGVNRIMQGWIPCSEVEAVMAEIAAEKAKIATQRVEAEQKQKKIQNEGRNIEQKMLAKIADRKAREEADKKAKIEDLLARQLETGYQIPGTFVPFVCSPDLEKNEATALFVSSEGFATAKCEGGELIRFRLKVGRDLAYLNGTRVAFSPIAAADARAVVVGDTILFHNLDDGNEGGDPREVTSWLLREEYQKVKVAANKAAETLSELATETAEEEAKRKQAILDSASAKPTKKGGGGNGGGKKGKNKN